MRFIVSLFALCIFANNLFAQHVETGWTTIPNNSLLIKYFGRWEKDSINNAPVMVSNWSGGYFKIGITSGILKIVLEKPINSLYVTIDDQPGITYNNIKDEFLVTPQPLERGKHTIRIAAGDQLDQLFVKELQIKAGQQIAPVVKSKLIEFIGNSITAGGGEAGIAQTSYSWLTAEKLKTENVRIAYSGIMLVTGIDFTKKWTVGMEDAYFKKQHKGGQDLNWYLSSSADWNFKDYQPDMIVVNIGTNDRCEPYKEHFVEVYLRFLQQIRIKNPNAKIVILPTFLETFDNSLKAMKPYFEQIVSEAKTRGLNNFYFVDTAGWINNTTDLLVDRIHPNYKGVEKIVNRLSEAIKQIDPSGL